MSLMFTREWIESFANAWNGDPEMVRPLSEARFSAIVALGLANHEDPFALLEVNDGRVARAGVFNPANSPKPDWDLRAALEQWQVWKKEGLGLNGLGVAVSSGKLQFRAGDYRKMIRNPQLATAFLRFFRIL
jgi:hypothetical protein